MATALPFLGILLIVGAAIGPPIPDPPLREPLGPGQGCTVIYATDGERVLGGNNEDYSNPLTRVWFIPGTDDALGRVYFGFDNHHAQGGMNEAGLFFDGLALNRAYPADTEGKEQYAGNLVDRAMSECATADCVAGLYDRYYTLDNWRWYFLFGDATGESALVEAGAIIRQRGGYQVATNFSQSAIPPESRTDPRYLTAVAGLEAMESLSVEAVRDLLDATHQEAGTMTLYSNVYDLTNRLVYLYYFHNYDDVVVLDLEEELAKGYHAADLSSLFAPHPGAEAWARPALRQYDYLVAKRLEADPDPAVLEALAGDYALPEGWGQPGEKLALLAGEGRLWLRFPDYRQLALWPDAGTELGFYHVTYGDHGFAVTFEARFGLDEARQVSFLELLYGGQSVQIERLGPAATVPEAAPTLTVEPTVSPAPTMTPSQSVPVLTPSKSVPALTPPKSVPVLTPSKSVPVLTPSKSVPVVMPPKSVPVLTPSKSVPVLTPSKSEAETAPPTPASATASPGAAPPSPTAEAEQATPEPEESGDFPWAWLLGGLALVGAAAGWVAVRRGK